MPSLFADSIILNLDFKITHIPQRLTDALGFEAQQLNGKSINVLSYQRDLVSLLRSSLLSGFFEYQVVTLGNSMSEPVRVEIAGFYLGLISDINGFIILQVRSAARAVTRQECIGVARDGWPSGPVTQ